VEPLGERSGPVALGAPGSARVGTRGIVESSVRAPQLLLRRCCATDDAEGQREAEDAISESMSGGSAGLEGDPQPQEAPRLGWRRI